VDIAKIEGSPRYKQAMRVVCPTDIFSSCDDKSNAELFNGRISQSALSSQSSQWLSHCRHMRNYGWSWPWPRPIRDPTETALEYMLKALKASTESYLEAPVHMAELTLPFRAQENDFQNKLRSACKVVGLRNALSRYPTAGEQAARAYGIVGHYPEEMPRLVLTVEYSRAALTMHLWEEDEATYMKLRVLHHTELGAAALQYCHESQKEEEKCESLLLEAMRPFLKLPVTGLDPACPQMIAAVALLGESSENHRLSLALKKILREQFEGVLQYPVSQHGSYLIDPVFAASRGIAEASWIAQQDLDFK
jgi:hypothetical protein